MLPLDIVHLPLKSCQLQLEMSIQRVINVTRSKINALKEKQYSPTNFQNQCQKLSQNMLENLDRRKHLYALFRQLERVLKQYQNSYTPIFGNFDSLNDRNSCLVYRERENQARYSHSAEVEKLVGDFCLAEYAARHCIRDGAQSNLIERIWSETGLNLTAAYSPLSSAFAQLEKGAKAQAAFLTTFISLDKDGISYSQTSKIYPVFLEAFLKKVCDAPQFPEMLAQKGAEQFKTVICKQQCEAQAFWDRSGKKQVFACPACCFHKFVQTDDKPLKQMVRSYISGQVIYAQEDNLYFIKGAGFVTKSECDEKNMDGKMSGQRVVSIY